MIFPRAARSWPAARRELIDAAPVCDHDGAGGSARAEIQRVRHSISVRVGLASKRKGGIKGSGAGDVSPDAEPVRGKIVIPYPALQVKRERRASDNGLGRGQPQKITAAQ